MKRKQEATRPRRTCAPSVKAIEQAALPSADSEVTECDDFADMLVYSSCNYSINSKPSVSTLNDFYCSPMRKRSWKKVMAEDYGDLDPNKVVLSFRGRDLQTEYNCIDKSLKEVMARRQREAAQESHEEQCAEGEAGTEVAAPQKSPESEESDVEIK